MPRQHCPECEADTDFICSECLRESFKWYNNPFHPIWSLIRILLINGSLLLAMYMNTKQWDTEFLIVAGVFTTSGSAEVAGQLLAKKWKNGK